MSECPLEITRQELSVIRDCEAVIVREYARADGSRFAIAVAWGDEEELQSRVKNGFLVSPAELTYLGDQVVKVSELLAGAKYT